MSSEFQQLADKVAQLARLAQSLRDENAELRRNVKTLTEDNAQLNQRIDEAFQRVAAALAELPEPAPAEPAETTEEAA
jgi:uncharacterized coiled-coil DUF342 family protein